ncbi:hypothetical protein [Methylocystis echinoides]|uniref:hypothetical protein n=1 Tax=Methylocystis echinoides TaxID=29468 RepID=UPI00343EEA6E
MISPDETTRRPPEGRDLDAAWLRCDAMRELAELLENLATSLRLAAARGSIEGCGVHLKQLRATLVEAIALYKGEGVE